MENHDLGWMTGHKTTQSVLIAGFTVLGYQPAGGIFDLTLQALFLK
jgi:hypothetical protein